MRTITLNPYIPHAPTHKQRIFLAVDGREALYGGAAGGGKSDALLMSALQYVHVPSYSALLFRRTYADLALPQALIPRSHDWLGGTDARWSEKNKTWTFPSGATVSFAYMEHAKDRYRYQGAELQFIGFDELTQFPEVCYRYMFSRLRRLEGMDVPVRMRAASNPGGVGHEWVRSRFIDNKSRIFISAHLQDNPYLDQEEYIQGLNELDPVTRRQLLNGDWDARETGGKFRREWFEIVDSVPAGARKVRRWDLAATKEKPGTDPDWTVGVLEAVHDGVFYICDVRRFRETPGIVERNIKATAELDGRDVPVRMEQEPGASGKALIDHYRRRVLDGFDFKGVPSTGDKTLRANPLSSAAEAGNVKLLRGAWIPDFHDELEAFPNGPHDDQVDGASGAHHDLTAEAEPRVILL